MDYVSDSNIIDLRGDGRILLYPRGAKGTYQARIKVPNSTGHLIKTTKTNRLHEATAFAVNLYDELYNHVKQGGTLRSSPTFKAVYDEWIKYELRRNITNTVSYYAVPFFGKDPIDKINEARLTDFWLHRQNTFIKRKPTNNTLVRERTYMNCLFRYAKAKGYIQAIPELNPLDISGSLVRRDTFSQKEWGHITRMMREWVNEPGIATSRDRSLAANYFLILANTGIRVGEARHLQWAHIRKQGDHVILFVTGKTGSREAVANLRSEAYFDRIRGYTGNQKLVFCHQDGTAIGSFKTAFHSLLEFAKIPKGTRSIYSLRHFYATMRLMNGVEVYHLAKQMGTSVEMIEKHYGHVINTSMADHLTKMEGSKKNT